MRWSRRARQHSTRATTAGRQSFSTTLCLLNPTIKTLSTALLVTGHELTLDIAPRKEVDPAQIARNLELTPAQRVGGEVRHMRGSAVSDEQHELVRALFAEAGVVEDISEEQVHAFIGAAGSLSAFTFSLIEAMTDEAVRLGFKRDLADRLVQQTVRGAATMLMQTGQHAAVAKNGVSSPGGTTVEGLAVMEREGVRPGIAAAMKAAADRSRELTGD